MINILYHEGKPYVTDKETFPDEDKFPQTKAGFFLWEKAVADFIRDHCSPIVEEDWEKVKELLPREAFKKKDHRGYTVEDLTRSMPVDHTIYKVDIETQEILQYRDRKDGMWFQCQKKDHNLQQYPNVEYRRAFRVI